MRYSLICDNKAGARVLSRTFNAPSVRAVPLAEQIAARELPYNFLGIRGEVSCALVLGSQVIHRFTVG